MTTTTTNEKAFLNRVIAGQSLNLAAWAAEILERGTMTESDRTKLARLQDERDRNQLANGRPC